MKIEVSCSWNTHDYYIDLEEYIIEKLILNNNSHKVIAKLIEILVSKDVLTLEEVSDIVTNRWEALRKS